MEIQKTASDTSCRILSPDDPLWMDFINVHPAASVFHHPAWVNLLADCYGYQPFVLAVLGDSGHVTGGVPLIEINRISRGNRLVALPFTDHCAPLYADESLNLLIKTLLNFYSDTGAKELELRWDIPTLDATQKESSHVLHVLDLDVDTSRILSHFQPAHRRNIRTAQASELEVDRGTSEKHLREFYRLHLETRKRQGMPVQPWRFFNLLRQKLLEPGLGFVLLAKKNSECIAASVFLHWRNVLIYKFGASCDRGLSYRPNNLLMWSAIQWGCGNGYTHFDFGRTDIENIGLRRFKSGFGAREIPLTYSTLSGRSVVSKSQPWLKIMRYTIQHSPKWVCRIAGELLYRYAG